MISNKTIEYELSKSRPNLYILDLFVKQEEKKDELISLQDNLIYHLENGFEYEVFNRLKIKIENLKKFIEEF